ncbi:very short patch repair endonuclease [Marinobacter sp.]|uniref:very short patch repair endonuclease n=1 Tax=Marinobacter sp. TaxID=50741 RepID=UPI000C65C61F|nr:very short patch repair endonuclease [Marinobacter sp.]MBE95898.1 very short patch repair endonuclease [Marinobacter sp.]|tara:strand:+ start:549 stop:986 length:438 start_codon:yes stop_codon:yes gene_type:complete
MNETPEQRRRTMKAVRSRDTKPEMVVRRFLHAKGLRYRLHERDLPGSPDIIFPGKKLVVFVHGCFWHQHPGCPASSRPKTNTEYWDKKLDRNVERDFSVIESLEQQGWSVKIVWECQIKNNMKLEELASDIKSAPVKSAKSTKLT